MSASAGYISDIRRLTRTRRPSRSVSVKPSCSNSIDPMRRDIILRRSAKSADKMSVVPAVTTSRSCDPLRTSIMARPFAAGCDDINAAAIPAIATTRLAETAPPMPPRTAAHIAKGKIAVETTRPGSEYCSTLGSPNTVVETSPHAITANWKAAAGVAGGFTRPWKTARTGGTKIRIPTPWPIHHTCQIVQNEATVSSDSRAAPAIATRPVVTRSMPRKMRTALSEPNTDSAPNLQSSAAPRATSAALQIEKATAGAHAPPCSSMAAKLPPPVAAA